MDRQTTFRTNFFSNPAVQGRILFLFFALTMLLIGITWVIALRALNVFGQAAMELTCSSSVNNDVQLLLEQQRAVLVTQLTVYSILSLILVGLGAVLISHHIGGPLHHLTAYCHGVAAGKEKPREIHFRKHDIPREVAEAFNEFQRHHGIVPPGKGDAGDSSDNKQS